MSYFIPTTFILFLLTTQACCLTRAAEGKCVLNQAREHYGNNLKV